MKFVLFAIGLLTYLFGVVALSPSQAPSTCAYVCPSIDKAGNDLEPYSDAPPHTRREFGCFYSIPGVKVFGCDYSASTGHYIRGHSAGLCPDQAHQQCSRKRSPYPVRPRPSGHFKERLH